LAGQTSCLRVELSDRAYGIQIGAGLLAAAGEFVGCCAAAKHYVVITDSNVGPLFADALCESFAALEDTRLDVLSFTAGEASKNIDSMQRLWGQMLEIGVDRGTVVIALGGGVVGDMAGFAAATFTRGLPFVQIPTTLLADVDSSVGGKVGVNLPGGKNMVGAFWQPQGVLIDTDLLASLPDREYKAGLAEVVKYGVILDEAFFAYLEGCVAPLLARDPVVLRQVISRCCQLKAEVVVADEREETGVRAVLNYGHTFCHALETVTEYRRFLHGEAVSLGMLCASRLAEDLGRVDRRVTARQSDLLQAIGLPIEVPRLDADALTAAMLKDKKTRHGKLRFVLPTCIGHVDVVDGVSPDRAKKAWWPK